MQSEILRAIEIALANHPGVLCAAVMVQQSRSAEPDLIAYILPDDDYVERTFSSPIDEAQRTEEWRKIYDLYQKPTSGQSMEMGFSSHVWQSVYTKQPIPDHEMREWISCTLDRIRQLHPTKLLDIGCGLGTLLLPLGPKCDRYVGTDISGRSIAALKDRMGALPGNWQSITLLERAAANFEGFVDGSFDTVVINSVCMYFPSVDYLTKVITGAMRMAGPNGVIFVGDVRSLPLHPNFAVSVEMFQAPSGLSLDELRLRVQKRLKLEKELLISPSYFIALERMFPETCRIEILPKRGLYDNEMNRFRYDVVIRLGSSTKSHIELSWLDWSDNKLTFELIDQKLRHQRPEILAITGVRNERIERDNFALEILSGKGEFPSLTELRQALTNMVACGVHPEKMSLLAAELGYQMDFSWASCRSNGSYDVVFYTLDNRVRRSGATFNWPRPNYVSSNMAYHVADPVRIAHRRKLVRYLRDSILRELGERLVPADFVVLDAMPTMSSGSIDRSALPLPWLSGL